MTEQLQRRQMMARKERIMTGWQMIAAERERQVSQEGWTAEHDDQHREGEMADAAEVYLLCAKNPGKAIRVLERQQTCPEWPWDLSWFKPFDRSGLVDPMRCLVKAGALFLAEADRYRRIQPTHPLTQQYMDRARGIAAKIDQIHTASEKASTKA